MKNIYRISVLALLLISTVNAQVNLNIGDGLTVETAGGVYLELSGDLEENNTGYLRGIVSSGNRGTNTISQFAGLIFSSGAVDKITRTTGTPLSSSSPKTSLRNYEIDNTSSFSSNISSDYIESGINNETNGIIAPFFYNKVLASWTGYLDKSTSINTISANDFSVPSGNSHIVISEGVSVATKIYLEGPYTSSSAMSTTLTGSIPLTSPYSEDPRTVSSIPSNAVDWVIVQLRDQTTPATVISSRSAFIKNDGNIIDDAGNNGSGVPASPGDYYIVVNHRNHLGVMSSTAQSISWMTP
jgi:hypothetical protein